MAHLNALLKGLALDDTGNEATSKCIPGQSLSQQYPRKQGQSIL